MTHKSPLQELILASASSRRNELLAKLSYPFQILASGVEEVVSRGMSPSSAVKRLAIQKATSIAVSRPASIVLAADTVIDFHGTLLGKPLDSTHAREMLRMLQGHTHEVLTGIAVVAAAKNVELGGVVSTKVSMRSCSEREIEAYVESREPLDKAGSYAIQGEGARLVESFCGCYNNVVGLPLCETVALLKVAGLSFARTKGICQLPTGKPCPRVGWLRGI